MSLLRNGFHQVKQRVLERLIVALVALSLLIPANVAAQSATIGLTPFPTASVADGRSSITVTAIVRDSSGRPVPDGTRVLFNTTLGQFRETLISTQQGVARAVLIAGGIPGTARITASINGLGAVANLEIEFLSDRKLLDQSQEYAEVTSPTFMSMNVDRKILEAVALGQGVSLRYRDIQIDCDSVQIDANSLEIRAKSAKLTMGKASRQYGELYLDLGRHRGYGITHYQVETWQYIPGGLLFAIQKATRDKVGLVSVRLGGIEPATPEEALSSLTPPSIERSTMSVRARKALIFPRKTVQFHRATIMVDGNRAFSFPLYELSLTGGSPIITDQIVNFNNNRIAVNYPHFLSLKPGQTSLLRFRTGESYGRGFGSIGGAFLDYELNWNKGDTSQGGFTVRGISRPDYGLGLQQFVRLDPRSSLSMQLDSSALRNIYGGFNFGRDLGGYQLSLSSSANRTLRGEPSTSNQSNLTIDKDPVRVGKLPLTFSYGTQVLTQSNSFAGTTNTQQAAGLRSQLNLVPQRLARSTTLNSYFSIGKFLGENVSSGPSLHYNSSISSVLDKRTQMSLFYDFQDDGFNNNYSGKHRLSIQSSFNDNNVRFSFFGSRGLDIDRLSYQSDVSYRIHKLWRVGYQNTYDRFLGSAYFDSGARLIYTYGLRDVGLTYSQRAKRFGVEILGASFN